MTHIVQLIKSAPFPMALAGLGLIFTFLVSWEVIHSRPQGWDLLYLGSCLGVVIGLGVILCSLADALSRLREYHRIKYLFLCYGFRTRILLKLSKSRCQRDAALQAARETNFEQKTKALFGELGYKWYHILPDMIVIDPRLFFHPKFLKTTFLPAKKKRSQTSFG